MSTSRVLISTPPPELLIASEETSMPSTSTATFWRPRVGDRPRTEIRVSLRAAPSSNSTEESSPVRSEMLENDLRSRSSALIAEIAIGTACRFSSRLRVVTTIWSICAQPVTGSDNITGLADSASIRASETPPRYCAIVGLPDRFFCRLEPVRLCRRNIGNPPVADVARLPNVVTCAAHCKAALP